MKNKKSIKSKNTNKLRIALVLGAIVLLSSCSMLLVKLSGDLKNPKLEDTSSLKKYSKKYKDPYDLLWIPNSKISHEEINQRYPGMPEVLIYDKAYNVLKNAHGEACQKLLIAFFMDSLRYEYKKINDSSYTFLKQRTRVIDSKNNPQHYDYTIVYSWVKWTPRLSKDVFQRLAEIKNSNKYKICFISLNKDYQKGLYDEAPHLSRKIGNGGSARAPKE